jgi:hypothetical protein
MAYGNWGAFVRRNGERMTQWEDATPYRENEQASGYYQAFMRGADGKKFNPHHAVLGDKRLRLCGYKCYPVLLVDGEQREINAFAIGEEDPSLYRHREYRGEIDGYEFRAECRENFVELYLREPDGATWTATCGFEYGAGHQ